MQPAPLDVSDIIQVANEAAGFVAHPFFARWITYASRLSDAALRDLKIYKGSDPIVERELKRNWILTEKILEQMQLYPANCIEAGRQASEMYDAQVKSDSGLLKETEYA